MSKSRIHIRIHICFVLHVDLYSQQQNNLPQQCTLLYIVHTISSIYLSLLSLRINAVRNSKDYVSED